MADLSYLLGFSTNEIVSSTSVVDTTKYYLLGPISPDASSYYNTKAFLLPKVTTVARDSLNSASKPGFLVYNVTISAIQQFMGYTNWVSITSFGGGGGNTTNPMTAAGDLIVGGTAGAATRLPVNSTASAEVLLSTNSTTDWISFNTLLVANNITPSLNYVGTFNHEPTQIELGSKWVQNALYKNSADGKSYILTGSPLAWLAYIEDGMSFYLTIESTNGTSFKVGENSSTALNARLFKNGAEITSVTPGAFFSWRRVSIFPQAPPKDDATWNASQYVLGAKSITVTVDDISSRATFFCDIRI